MFKQPRVPEYREGTPLVQMIKQLVLFLKDFCTDAWVANQERTKEIKELRDRLNSLTGGE